MNVAVVVADLKTQTNLNGLISQAVIPIRFGFNACY